MTLGRIGLDSQPVVAPHEVNAYGRPAVVHHDEDIDLGLRQGRVTDEFREPVLERVCSAPRPG